MGNSLCGTNHCDLQQGSEQELNFWWKKVFFQIPDIMWYHTFWIKVLVLQNYSLVQIFSSQRKLWSLLFHHWILQKRVRRELRVNSSIYCRNVLTTMNYKDESSKMINLLSVPLFFYRSRYPLSTSKGSKLLKVPSIITLTTWQHICWKLYRWSIVPEWQLHAFSTNKTNRF